MKINKIEKLLGKSSFKFSEEYVSSKISQQIEVIVKISRVRKVRFFFTQYFILFLWDTAEKIAVGKMRTHIYLHLL